jgi:4-hydroxy-tetrahydrodipicolinate synthase
LGFSSSPTSFSRGIRNEFWQNKLAKQQLAQLIETTERSKLGLRGECNRNVNRWTVVKNIFCGCIPALMTPCDQSGQINFDALVSKGRELMAVGMTGVVYCGSMGDWPLLSDAERQEGVTRLVDAGVPVVVGTGAQNTRSAAAHAAHARDVGAAGLMVIPRVLSRGTSVAAQRGHFAEILRAGGSLPAVIYNSPYYGFETKAPLFFELRRDFPSLVGFKEFGGSDSLTYAAEHITSGDPNLTLMVGVDTQVFHGFVNCGAGGAITGVGNALPREVLRLVELCQRAAGGCATSRQLAAELEGALRVLSTFDEGPDLVLYYKYLMVLEGNPEYQHHFNASDQLSPSQKAHLENQWRLFRNWWAAWGGATDCNN